MLFDLLLPKGKSNLVSLFGLVLAIEEPIETPQMMPGGCQIIGSRRVRLVGGELLENLDRLLVQLDRVEFGVDVAGNLREPESRLPEFPLQTGVVAVFLDEL